MWMWVGIAALVIAYGRIILCVGSSADWSIKRAEGTTYVYNTRPQQSTLQIPCFPKWRNVEEDSMNLWVLEVLPLKREVS